MARPPATAEGPRAMKLSIRHRIEYHYDRPVFLQPHVFRLRPRSEPALHLLRFTLDLHPQPAVRAEHLDLHGNTVTEAWFEAMTTALVVESRSVVETMPDNPFAFLLAEPDRTLPEPYGARLAAALSSCRRVPNAVHPQVREMAAAVGSAVQWRPERFPLALAMHLHRTVATEVRESATLRPSEMTLALGRGSGADVAALFVEGCQAAGLAARFVAGYYVDPEAEAEADGSWQLHAWGEVYLPGGGWRGYDPVSGLAISGSHIAIAVGGDADEAAPLSGTCLGGTASVLQASLEIQPLGGE